MPQNIFYTTYSNKQHLFSRAKNSAESWLSGVVSYRFGFNGKENDNEVKGTGNSVDFGARMYDSRLGRWMSMDPLQEIYVSLSSYQFAANNPVYFADSDGRKIRGKTKEDIEKYPCNKKWSLSKLLRVD